MAQEERFVEAEWRNPVPVRLKGAQSGTAQFRPFAENEVDWQGGAMARSAKAVVRNVLGKK